MVMRVRRVYLSSVKAFWVVLGDWWVAWWLCLMVSCTWPLFYSDNNNNNNNNHKNNKSNKNNNNDNDDNNNNEDNNNSNNSSSNSCKNSSRDGFTS